MEKLRSTVSKSDEEKYFYWAAKSDRFVCSSLVIFKRLRDRSLVFLILIHEDYQVSAPFSNKYFEVHG